MPVLKPVVLTVSTRHEQSLTLIVVAKIHIKLNLCFVTQILSN